MTGWLTWPLSRDLCSPMIHPHFPNEILAIIVNELASGMEDNESLAASLPAALHVLCSLATPLLFSSIRLTDLTSDCRVIAPHRRLSIHLDTELPHPRSWKCYPHFFHPSSSSTDPKFCLLKSGIEIPEDLASAIQALCRSPSLTTLYLDNFTKFSFTAITACPNLRYLRLWGVMALQVSTFCTNSPYV